MAKGRGLGKGLDSLISGKYSDTAKKSEQASVESKEGKEADVKSAGASKKNDAAASSAENSSKKTASSSAQTQESEPEGPLLLKIGSIEPNRDQPRKDFDEASLEELASSIRKHGILQPILVRKSGRRYEIIAGERRWRAAKLAHLKEVPVVVKELDDKEATEISLIENIQREDLNPVEEALAYQRLMDEFLMTQEQLAERVGKSRAAIANRVRLLKLAEEVREMLIQGKLTEGHARALIALEVPQLQIQAANEVIDQNLTVRETEKLVKRYLAPPAPAKKETFSEADILAYKKLEEELRNSTGTKVEIHRSSQSRGKIVLDYYSMEELERLADLFRRFKEV